VYTELEDGGKDNILKLSNPMVE